MPLSVLDTRGIRAIRRERIMAAIEAGGKNASGPFEAWATADGHGSVRVVITGPQGFDRQVLFTVDEVEAAVWEALEASAVAGNQRIGSRVRSG